MCSVMNAGLALALLWLVVWLVYVIMRDDKARRTAELLEAELRGARRIVCTAMSHPSRAGSDTVERLLRDELKRVERAAEQARNACGNTG